MSNAQNIRCKVDDNYVDDLYLRSSATQQLKTHLLDLPLNLNF